MSTDPIARFRARAKWCLQMPLNGASRHTIVVDGQPFVAAEGFFCGDKLELREALMVKTRFACGSGCTFFRPVYASGDAEVGKETFMEAILAEGNLTLGPRAEVRDWVHSDGILHLRHNAWVGGSATAGLAITMGDEATAMVVEAPEVSTLNRQYGAAANPGWAPDLVRQLHAPSRNSAPPELPGADRTRWQVHDSMTWIYRGSLALEAPIWLRANLQVHGAFACPAGSLLEGEVIGGGSVKIGAGSVCGQAVLAAGDLVLENDAIFQGELESGQTLRLRSGVRGFRQDGPVVAWSKGAALLESNVVVRGRVEARGMVRAV